MAATMASPHPDLTGINPGADTAVEDGPAGFSLHVPQHLRTHRPSGSSLDLSAGGADYHPSTIRDLKSTDLQDRLSNERPNSSGEAQGSIAYFRLTSNSGVRMDRCQPSVLDIIASQAGFDTMDQKWTKPHEGVIAPNFRWVHLPANDPEWVKVRWLISDMVIADEPSTPCITY